MKTVRTLLRQGARLVIIAPMVTLLYGPTEGMAALVLCSDMASFTVRGASTVTNVVTSSLVGRLCSGPASFTALGAATATNLRLSTIVGNVGAQSNGGANAIVGFRSGQGHAGPALARSARGKLTAARGNPGSSGRGTLLAAKPRGHTPVPDAILDDVDNDVNKTDAKDLCGRNPAKTGAGTLTQNSLSSTCMDMLTGENGLGELYVKTLPGGDTVIAFLHGPVTAVPVAILDDEDNDENKSDAKDLCGRGPANTSAGTLTQNSLSGNCMDILAGDKGLGELQVETIPGGDTVIAFLHGPVTAVPEPGTLLLFGFGLMGLFVIRKRVLPAP